MKQETVDLVIQTLQAQAFSALEHEEKLMAMEQAMASYPETEEKYRKELEHLRETRTAEVNREAISRSLDKLRRELLQDRSC